MQKSYNFSRAIPCLPTRLLSCRAHIRRDSWGVMGVAARSTLSKREVMSKNRGIRRTSQQKEGKRVPKIMLLAPWQFALQKKPFFDQTVRDPWLGIVEWMPCFFMLPRDAVFYFCQNLTAICFVCISIAVFFEVPGVGWSVTIWVIFSAATGNVKESYGAPPVWISEGINIKFP